MGNYRIGQGYIGSNEVKTSQIGTEVVQQHKPGAWTIPLSVYKFTFYPFANCKVKINGGDEIQLLANMPFSIDHRDKPIITFEIMDVSEYIYFGAY